MAPWLRSTRLTGLVRVTGLLVVLVAGAVPAVHAAEPDPASSRAGSRAGEGRERPGREDAWPMAPDDTYAPSEVPVPVPEPDGPETGTSVRPDTAPPPPAAPPGAGTATAEEPVLRVMALGSGLILMGVGLGLAFVGLRIRRY
ncbi:hypothetical protein [Streptomyces sp. NPDC057438]|uniref:hypothetical protein n=1 Tax=Streptomyces sp. NPDC057438 TaxID=3346133 RepID=UPI00368E9A41